jgi:hypothetical protein
MSTRKSSIKNPRFKTLAHQVTDYYQMHVGQVIVDFNHLVSAVGEKSGLRGMPKIFPVFVAAEQSFLDQFEKATSKEICPARIRSIGGFLFVIKGESSTVPLSSFADLFYTMRNATINDLGDGYEMLDIRKTLCKLYDLFGHVSESRFCDYR